jgi:hypothetical protein
MARTGIVVTVISFSTLSGAVLLWLYKSWFQWWENLANVHKKKEPTWKSWETWLRRSIELTGYESIRKELEGYINNFDKRKRTEVRKLEIKVILN